MHVSAHRVAFKIALTYIIIGVVWIIFSDKMSFLLSKNGIEDFLLFQRYKGWLFVFVTGIMLYFLIENRTKQVMKSTAELKEKELELKTSNFRYQSLFHHHPDAVIELSSTGTIQSINPAGKGLFRLSENQIGTISFTSLVEKKDLLRIKDAYKSVLNGNAETFEIPVMNLEKEQIMVRMTLLPIVINGSIIGMYGIAKNVTDQKRNEELMIKNEKMYVIGQLAASVAHEIRNPLTSIKGFVQLMKETNKKSDTYLELIMSEIDRIHSITSEMLYLGKNEAIHFENVSLQELLYGTTLLMNAEAHMNNTYIQIHSSEQSIFVSGDPNLLKQVFINIIKNSIEAIKSREMDAPGVIDIHMKRNENHVVVDIHDNGIGMDEERVKRLGEPFYSTKEKGTGLGLTVSMKIMKRHNGTIEFNSKKGEGTSVFITFPLPN